MLTKMLKHHIRVDVHASTPKGHQHNYWAKFACQTPLDDLALYTSNAHRTPSGQ
jgi:hypothetical protein